MSRKLSPLTPLPKGEGNKRFALLAPFASVLALLTALVASLLMGLARFGLYTPSSPDALTRALQVSGAVFVLGLAIYAIILPDKVREILIGRQVRYGSNLAVLTLAFLGILISLNYLAYKNPQKWDITTDKSRTLADETIEVLTALPEKVEATAFFTAYTDMSAAEELLLDFKSSSNGNFDYQFVDPDLNPVVAREAGITGDGKILLTMGDRQEIVPFASEQELLRGLLRLLNPGERTLYFLTGHGEYELNTASERSASRVLETLSEKNYTVLPLNLLAENAIPNDALTIIIFGATEPLTDNEIALLDDFLANGGSLVVLTDPTPISDLADKDDSLTAYLAEKWGVLFEDNLIIDPSVNPPSNAVSYSYAAHPITEKLNNLAVYMPFARSLSITEDSAFVHTELAITIERSWGETDFSALDADGDPVEFEIGEDKPGPLAMAVSVEDVERGARLVVFGNATFAGDETFDAYGNGDLFVNAVDWAAEQESLISLTPRQQVERTFIPPSQGQLVVILISSICLLPGMMIVGGFVAWRNRKRLG